ncbi:MAG: hypothetical protein BMS9Abin37_1608 [Acidobacteriota bacterium]|nr:MAG: hypothetical protein BMS9Abin37_1608 [Acidobacteriota bacterium]
MLIPFEKSFIGLFNVDGGSVQAAQGKFHNVSGPGSYVEQMRTRWQTIQKCVENRQKVGTLSISNHSVRLLGISKHHPRRKDSIVGLLVAVARKLVFKGHSTLVF